MPRTPEQNQNIKDKRRSKLLLHALKAFATKGYGKTAIDDITKSAKCSHGLFYHYFDSKEAVLSALIKEVLCDAYELPTKQALSVGGMNGLRVLCDYAEKVSKVGGTALLVAKVTFSLGQEEELDDQGKRFALEHDLESTLVTLIKEGQQEGKAIAGDPRDIARIFVEFARGALSAARGKNDPVISADVLFAMASKSALDC